MFRIGIFLACFVCGSCAFSQSNIVPLEENEQKLNQTFLIDQNTDQKQVFLYESKDVRYRVTLNAPVIVYQAEKPESWGFVQFPSIQYTQTGDLLVMWNLSEDKIGSTFKKGWKYSKNFGETWQFNWKRNPDFKGYLIFDNQYVKFGNKTNRLTKKEKLVKSYKVGQKKLELFEQDGYFSVDLYRQVNGTTDFVKEQVTFDYKNQVYGFSIDNFVPNTTWGKMEDYNKNATEILKIQYPVYLKSDPNYASVALLASKDIGKTWVAKSFLPFGKKELDLVSTYISDIQGFDETAFLRVNEKKLVVVNRTTTGLDVAPLLQYQSQDNGKSWSDYTIISPNGVYPQLLKLNKDLFILSSGRPGVQIRFSINEMESWSSPLNLLKFEGIKGQVSCGYTGLLKLDDQSFLIVYSDFRTKNNNNEYRKSIVVRKIKVKKIDV